MEQIKIWNIALTTWLQMRFHEEEPFYLALEQKSCNKAALLHCKWLPTQDVLSQDYLKSIKIKPLTYCSLLTYDRTCEDEVKYLLLTAWVLCAVPQKLIRRCQAKAHWLLGVSEWTVSEPLCLIWGTESSFESSCCFYFLQELTLSF